MRRFRRFVVLALGLGFPLASEQVCHAVAHAYVTNSDDDSVSVIDTSSNVVIATVRVGRSPFGVAVHPSGQWVYVTNEGGGSLSVIETRRNTVTATLPAGTQPEGIAINPAGTRLYVVTGQDGVGTVFVFDTASNQRITSIPVDFGPLGVAVDSTGTQVYVTSTLSGGGEQRPCFFNPMLYCTTPIWVIDAINNAVVTRFTIGDDLYGVAANPCGGSAYVANISVIGGAAWGAVSVVDVGENGVVRTIKTQDRPLSLAVNASGSRIYATSFFGVTVIDTSKSMMIDYIPVGNVGLGGISVTPDDRQVYVPCCGDKVAVIDAARNVVTSMIPVGRQPRSFGQFIGPDISPPPPVCVGDCQGRHSVDVTDILAMVNIALGTAQGSACPLGFPDDATVTIALIMQAVNNALGGCPSG